MLKTAGICLILLGGTGLGLCQSYALTRRAKALEMLIRMTILLKAEIRCGNASLHDAFYEAAAKLPGEYGEFLKAVAERMQNPSGRRFGEIFRECAEEKLVHLKLSKEEQEKLYTLGGYLGYLDLEMQMKQLELYEQELQNSLEELRAEMPAKKKVYQSLGVSGGILLAVLVW